MSFLYILKVQIVKPVLTLRYSYHSGSHVFFPIHFLSVPAVTLTQPEYDFREKYVTESLGRFCGEYVYPVALPANLKVAIVLVTSSKLIAMR